MPSFLLIAVFAVGVGLLLSTFAAYFADVLDMFQILLTLWMYLTPVIYPRDIMPERYRWVFDVNPMCHLLEVFRSPIYAGWLTGSGTVAVAAASALLALLLGWWVFTSKADELAYRL